MVSVKAGEVYKNMVMSTSGNGGIVHIFLEGCICMKMAYGNTVITYVHMQDQHLIVQICTLINSIDENNSTRSNCLTMQGVHVKENSRIFFGDKSFILKDVE